MNHFEISARGMSSNRVCTAALFVLLEATFCYAESFKTPITATLSATFDAFTATQRPI